MSEKREIRAIVAEDNEINQKLISVILTKLHIQFDIAENGLKCLEYLTKNDYDIIFMDIHMPYMDGYEAAREIRKSGNNIPIIAVTANISSECQKNVKEVGMNDYMTKPYLKDEIIKKITQWTNYDHK